VTETGRCTPYRYLLRKFGLVYLSVCVFVLCVWCRQFVTFGHSAFIHDKFPTLICLLYADFRLSYTTDERTFHAFTQWHSKTSPKLYFVSIKCQKGQLQWPRDLRRGSVTARLLWLQVRILPWIWMSVCCECCVLSGRGLCDGLITCPEESYWLWCV